MAVVWEQAAQLVTGGGITAVLTIVERVLGHSVGVYILLPTSIALFVIAFYRAWAHENARKEELLARLAKPDLRGQVKQLLTDSANEGPKNWVIAAEVTVTNHIPGTTTIEQASIEVFTDNQAYLGDHISGDGLLYSPFGAGPNSKQLESLQLPKHPAPDGFAFGKGYTGWLCFKVNGADSVEELEPIAITIVLHDALGNRHEVRSTPPWPRSGSLGRWSFYVV